MAVVARFLSGYLPAGVSDVTVALVLGLILGPILVPRVRDIDPGVTFAAQRVLRLGIVLLGARLSLGEIARIGLPATIVVVVTMAVALAVVLGLARLATVPPRLAVMLAMGASICGNSAIIATAPVIGARGREVAYAVATITLFGTAAVFAFPLIGRALALDDATFGLWAGLAVHDTSQVVAAGAAYSPDALEVATVVKLIRNLLMAPLLLAVAWVWARRMGDDGEPRRPARQAVPVFVLGFLGLAALRTAGVIGPDLAAILDVASRWAILVALAGVGLSIRLAELRSVGWRPLAVGFGAAVLIGAGTLAAILSLDLAGRIGD